MFGLAATTVLLLLGTTWVGRAWRLPVSLCAIAALVGVPAAFEARNAWLAGGGVPVVYHYVGWAVSIPVQVMALYFLAKTSGKLGAGLFWRLIVVAELMVFVRYLGEAQYMHPTLAFLIGLVFWLYILGELYFGRMDDAVRASTGDYLRRGYFWLRLIVTVGWAIYPLGNFLTAFAGMTDDGSLSVAYNVADILNRMAFGVAVLATGVLVSEETKNA
ncbi:MAG: bacteriorhodopsin [Burkholderiales bacterium]|nr:bacteriorhodopsin [Burkholderiales bacterium]